MTDKNKIYPDWYQAGENPPKPGDFNAEGDVLFWDGMSEPFCFECAVEQIEYFIKENSWWAKAPDGARARNERVVTDYDIASPMEMKVTTTDKEIALPKKKDPVLLEDEIKRLEGNKEPKEPTGLIVPVLSDLGKAYKILEKREKEIINLREKCDSFKEDYEGMIELRNRDKQEYTKLQSIYSENEDELCRDIQALKVALRVLLK